MASVVLAPSTDEAAIGPWQIQGALSMARALANTSDNAYVWTDRPRGGMVFTVKLAPPRDRKTLWIEEGPFWVDLRVLRLSAQPSAVIRTAIIEGKPQAGTVIRETGEIGFTGAWRTRRTQLKRSEGESITDFADLYLRVRIVRARGSGSIAISGASFKVPDERREWKKAAKAQPAAPATGLDVRTVDRNVYRGIKYDGEWSFADDSPFETPSRAVQLWE